MSVKIKNFSQLKSALQKQSVEMALSLISKGEYLEAIEEIERLGKKGKIQREYRIVIGEAYYQAAKIKQNSGNWNQAIGYINKALEFNDNLFVARERLSLLRTFLDNQKSQSITIKA